MNLAEPGESPWVRGSTITFALHHGGRGHAARDRGRCSRVSARRASSVERARHQRFPPRKHATVTVTVQVRRPWTRGVLAVGRPVSKRRGTCARDVRNAPWRASLGAPNRSSDDLAKPLEPRQSRPNMEASFRPHALASPQAGLLWMERAAVCLTGRGAETGVGLFP